ncbi:hypothetical protein FXF51_28220 [Nonomuraea sp. PA05]|uniref:hypothetical protein n=1 Tax=Nonomuraea sp. PA05 TaxID=2604466 RepID=UPI0011D9DD73|nr:hypothetical protein [Nonomuraea sp. PA05]TYB61351.1 hypothetical protein FXF51_28220 [Nonomuraea sp. PA05]
MARWLTRDDLGAAAGSATGLLLVSPDVSSVFPLSPGDRTAAAGLTGAALREAGAGERDRVVVALAEPAGALWTSAAADVAEAAARVDPRGRMRLHHALSALKATTLVATPTGAMDFLARLHLEFLLDPLDLGLRNIVLTGEIAAKRTLGHLAGEFGATVTEVLASPFSGGALAWRGAEEEPLRPLADGVLGLAALAKDGPPDGDGPAELVVTPAAHSTLGDAVLRTGLVARAADGEGIPAPAHTVGEHVLVRGVWLALPRIDKALSRIDGVAGWELAISRQGTLDTAALTVTFARRSLVGNPMWKSRIEQAVRALTPVSIAVEIAQEVSETPAPGTVHDLRGHHLGRDRALIT